MSEDARHFYLNVSKNATEEIDGEKLFKDTEAFSRSLKISVKDQEIRLTLRSKNIKELTDLMAAIQDSRMEAVS